MKNVWLIAGAIVGCSAGAGLAACSSGSTTGGAGASSASSSSGSTSSSSSGGGSGGSPSSSSSSGTGGVACSKDVSTTACQCPSTLHPPSVNDAGAALIYCPFSAPPDGGDNQLCLPGTAGAAGQVCCETAADAGAPSACQPSSTACTGGTLWECDDPSECTDSTKPVCCATPKAGDSVTLPVDDPVNGMTCAGHFASDMTGTACMAACPATSVVICTSNSQCPAGKTCLPFRKAGNDVGGCQ